MVRGEEMKLANLLNGISTESLFDEQIEVKNIAFNSSQVTAGDMFVCLVGSNTDGHEYACEAIDNGCVCIVCQKPLKVDCTQIIVQNTRKALAIMSANFYGNPARDLKLIGITGTNGKTSTTLITRDILMTANKSVGVVGTLGYFVGNKHFDCDLTTPDPIKLHQIFLQMKNSGVEYVVMEVSAHAIALEKIYGLEYEIAALTNITQDHLDFFGTMDNYIKTKFKFLKSDCVKSLVLNSDDESIHFLENELTFSYGINHPADCFAMDISLDLGKSKCVLNLFDNVISVKTKLSGMFNIYNILLAATISSLLGIDPITIKKAIAKAEIVEGRFNVVSTNKGSIVIDFAHTPDGLENILKSVRQTASKRLICVFGCGGNRDSKKRPIMGEIAEKYSDFCIITADNPRFENPDLIASDILEGVNDVSKFIVQNDRRKAIEIALNMLDDKSIVVICGKGGEKYQDINGIMSPFDDIEVTKKIAKKLGYIICEKC